MNTKLTIQLLSIFIAAISMAIVPAILTASATIVSTPGTSPDTLWSGSGPASDVLRLQYYTGLTGDTNEYNALCFGIASCTPQISMTDVQIPTSLNTPANNNDPRFYVTPSSPGLDWEHLDFNLANSFFGVEFCNGSDGAVSGSPCPLATYASPVTATCPGVNATAIPAGMANCTFAGIALRQAIAHLLDKQGYVSTVLQNFGAPIDNILAPAQTTLHSGYDYSVNGLQTPCATVGGEPGCAGGTSQNTVGRYYVDPTLPIGSQQVWPQAVYPTSTYTAPTCTTPAQIEGLSGACYLTVGGACSWDVLVGCGTFMGQTTVSANHLSGDGASTSNGDVNPGTPDFCAAAHDFVNAGLGTGVTSAATGCQILNFCQNNGGGTACFTNTAGAGLPGNNPVLLYRRTSLDRGPLATGIGQAICQLINGPSSTTCSQVVVRTITLGAAGSLVFSTGCKSATEAGTTCSTQGPNRTWQIYSGGNTLGVAVNTLFFEVNTQDNSDLCGGTAPGQEPSAYYSVCNTAMNTWSQYGQFAPLPNNAIADTQVANDIAGNHTFLVNLMAHAAQYAWLAGTRGVCNAPGVGIAQGNFFGPLNAYPAVPSAPVGPTITWGQKDSPDTLNPFSATTVTDFDVIQSVYDSLLVGACYNLSSLFGYMVNSYQIVQNPGVVNPTAQTDSNCPLNVQTGSGLFGVGGCVKMVLRGDNSWQDIYNCAPTVSSCLASHSVTASDVKFTWQNINATGGLLTGNTANTVDVLYNPSSLPSSAFGSSGGTQANGQPEIFYIALKQLSAWALFDISAVPILPQHVWATASATALPCLSPTLGTATVTDLHSSDPACKADSAKLSGPGSDPVSNNRLIGSSAFVCASGTLGASGTVIGGGCSTSGNGTPAAGDAITLRRFQYQGTNAAQQGSLSLNYAYFRTNGKFLNFAWSDYLALGSGANNGDGAHGLIAINDIQSVASCLGKTAPAGTCTAAAFAHWSAPAASITCNTSIGPCIGAVGGGSSPVSIGAVAQVSRWYSTQWYDQQASTASLPAPLLYGVNGNQLVGSEPAPGSGTLVLYEDGSTETA